MNDRLSLDMFSDAPGRPGGLGCRVEISATMADAIRQAAARGLDRDAIAERMSFHLGEKVSVATLNGFTAPSHTDKAAQNGAAPRDISLLRAMAFDAALNSDVLLSLYARRRGERRVITSEEAAYIELGRIHQEEKDLAERKRALQVMLRGKK